MTSDEDQAFLEIAQGLAAQHMLEEQAQYRAEEARITNLLVDRVVRRLVSDISAILMCPVRGYRVARAAVDVVRAFLMGEPE